MVRWMRIASSPPTIPSNPVADALELIKAEVDELFRTRRKAETALRQSEERYRTIIDTIVDGYYEINLRGQVMFCNDALLRIFGFTRSEVDELDALALLASDDRDRAVSVFTRVYETGEPAHSIDWEISTRDGNTDSHRDVDFAHHRCRRRGPGLSRHHSRRHRTHQRPPRKRQIWRLNSNAPSGWRPSERSPEASPTISTTS